MTLPALSPVSPPTDGLRRSALLMRALGAKAASVWSQLSPDEAEKLSAEMQELPDDDLAERGILRSYVDAMRAAPSTSNPSVDGIWAKLSTREGGDIVRLIENESPQIIALILSRLTPAAAAKTVRALPRGLATEVLKRLLNLGNVHPGAVKALENVLKRELAPASESALKGGHAKVAEIFDRLDSESEQSLLSNLDGAEPGAGEKIRALMFTFDDLSRLDPASLQTILVNVDRAVLTIALKDAADAVTEAFFQNITQRAGELMREDIASTGPVRRSDIETARAEVLTIARTLVKRGDILAQKPDDELVE